MATIIFEQVSVSRSLDANGNKQDVYRYWTSEHGTLGRFRASEKIGYGENVKWQSFNFVSYGVIADRLHKMKLKEGSKLYILGELIPEVFEGKEGKVNRMVVKILDVRFASGSMKKNDTHEKVPEKTVITETREKNNAIPIPKVNTSNEQKNYSSIPVPKMQKVDAKEVDGNDEILNLDIEDIFSSSSGFMGM